jgi:hypothetical protein
LTSGGVREKIRVKGNTTHEETSPMTTTINESTEKQVRYALALLAQNGFRTDFMGKAHGKLGATMRERHGRVEGWLRSIGRQRCSTLIDDLKAR